MSPTRKPQPPKRRVTPRPGARKPPAEEALTARAVREEKNLTALVAEILEAAAASRLE